MNLNLSTILQLLFITLGLAVFEIVSSMDNAIINANILDKIKHPKARQFFVTWGMIMAVGVVRGLLPFLIYYIPNSSLGLQVALTSFWSGNPAVVASVKSAEPLLLLAGGIFLTLLFMHWSLLEEKELSCAAEGLLHRFGGAWFYAVAALELFVVMYYLRKSFPAEQALNYTLAAAIGVVAFFVADGFKEHAEAVENRLAETGGDVEAAKAAQALSDWTKVLFLEVIDMTFSTDGVIGAFAFTMLVPLILIGNGLGAYVVRRLTLSNVKRLAEYPLIKNGAMWSIGILGATMMAEGFGTSVPFWFSPLVTFACVGSFFGLAIRAKRNSTPIVTAAVEAGQ